MPIGGTGQKCHREVQKPNLVNMKFCRKVEGVVGVGVLRNENPKKP